MKETDTTNGNQIEQEEEEESRIHSPSAQGEVDGEGGGGGFDNDTSNADTSNADISSGYTPLQEMNITSMMMEATTLANHNTTTNDDEDDNNHDDDDDDADDDADANLMFTMGPNNNLVSSYHHDDNAENTNNNDNNEEWDFDDYNPNPSQDQDNDILAFNYNDDHHNHENNAIALSSEGAFYTSLGTQITLSNTATSSDEDYDPNVNHGEEDADDGDDDDGGGGVDEIKEYNLLQNCSSNDQVVDLDFNALAEQALQNLEQEYSSTAMCTTNENETYANNINNNDGDNSATNNVQACIGKDDCQNDKEGSKDVNDLQVNAIQTAEEVSPFATSPNTTTTATKSSNETTLFEAKFEQSAKNEDLEPKPIININKEAISKAMRNIRINASSSLISKLDVGSYPLSSSSHRNQQQEQKQQEQKQQEVDAINTSTSATVAPTTSAAAVEVALSNTSSFPIAHVPREHPLIPSKALLAFRRGNTTKSIDATSRLTRSATLADAIVCLFEAEKIGYDSNNTTSAASSSSGSSNKHADSNVFIVHIVGSDHVECASKETLEMAIGPFVQWWKKASSSASSSGEKSSSTSSSSQFTKFISSFEHLRIEFLGPNVPVDATKRQPLLLYPKTVTTTTSAKRNISSNSNTKKKGLKTATAVCKNCLYHDYINEINEKSLGGGNHSDNSKLYPHCIIAYNAGIWGYDDWNPTVERMDLLPAKTPFAITSYTVQEAEDDAEAMETILNGSSLKETRKTKGEGGKVIDSMLLGPTGNPYGSRKIRKTFTSPSSSRQYHENAAWQIWMLGGSD